MYGTACFVPAIDIIHIFCKYVKRFSRGNYKKYGKIYVCMRD